MTTRAEIKDALETIRPRLQAWQIDDALKVVMPLLNRAERTAGYKEKTLAEADAYILGVNDAADLHEQIDPASDDERIKGHPGAGAMGAVIEYRDKIRALLNCPIRSGAKA